MYKLQANLYMYKLQAIIFLNQIFWINLNVTSNSVEKT